MVAKNASKLFNESSDGAGAQSPPAGSKTTGRNLTYTIGNVGNTMTNSKCDNGLLSKDFSDNLVRPTPDEKKRSYFPKNLNVR